MGLLDAFRRIFGGFFGDAFPPREPPPLAAKDARQHALEAFADFVATLAIANPGSVKEPTFTIPRAQVFTEQPPDPTQLKFPSVATLPGRGRHDNFRLGPPPEDIASRDVYAPGTILLQLGEYSELVSIEVWGSHDAQRTAVFAGIADAMRVGEWSSSLLLPLPNYFGRVARFTIEESEHIDDPDVARGRVRAHLYLRLEVPEVLLVNAIDLRPYFRLDPPTSPTD